MTDSDSKQQDMHQEHSPIDKTMANANADVDWDVKSHPHLETTPSKSTREENQSQPQCQSRPSTPPTTTPCTSSAPTTAHRRPPPSLTTLPTELVHLIADHLAYPDILSLMQSHRSLPAILSRYSTTHARISWVLSRAYLGLPIPNNTKLSFKTDALFLSNREVQRILAARLDHKECLSQDDLGPARQLARSRHGDRKGANLCFITGGPCVAVLERRRRSRNRLGRGGARSQSALLLETIGWVDVLVVLLCLVLLWVVYRVQTLL
ncbi:hypothetical protein RBB50_010579 [Rhinocladiella similis]